MVGLWVLFAGLWLFQCVQVYRLMWVAKHRRSNAYTAGYLKNAVNGFSITAVMFMVATVYLIVWGF